MLSHFEHFWRSIHGSELNAMVVLGGRRIAGTDAKRWSPSYEVTAEHLS